MYRGTPYLNRHLKKREEQRSMEYHLSNLTQIRPRTSTIEYMNQVHINNKKGELQKEARFTEIERENRILLEKISSIMGKHSRKAQSQQKINRSLNSDFRKRQLQNIEIENAKLLKRLQDRKPNYETQKFKQSWKKQKYVIKNLSNYPFIINDRKRKRSSVSQIGGKEPKSNTIELCRMRVIDGVSFLITVRLNQSKMQIIGDTKDKKEIKVIEIDRNEAIQFIEQECQGKIQKIFDCLRYDKVDQVLYLVANEVEIDDVKNQSPDRKRTMKRDENPQFDISLENEPQRSTEQVPGEIPIRVSNGSKKYWVEVEKKQSQKQRQSPKQKQKDHQFQYEEFEEQSRDSNTRKLASKQEERSKMSNKVESSVNTHQKIKKLPEEQNFKVEAKNSPEKKEKEEAKKQPQKAQQKIQESQEPLPAHKNQESIEAYEEDQGNQEKEQEEEEAADEEKLEDQEDLQQQQQYEQELQNKEEIQKQDNLQQQEQNQQIGELQPEQSESKLTPKATPKK